MAEISQTRHATVGRRVDPLAWIFYGLVSLALVTRGANTTLSFTASLWLAGALCLAALLLCRPSDAARGTFLAGIAVFLGTSVWIAIQILPMPSGIAAPIWSELGAAGLSGADTISVAPGDTIAGWLRLALPFVTFAVGLLIFRTDEDALHAFRIVSLFGSGLAILLLAEFMIAPDSLFFAERPVPNDSYTFAFVNRNNGATCLGLLVLMLIVRLREEWLRLDRTRLSAWILHGTRSRQSLRLAPFLLQTGLLFIVLVCLALTRSRAGIGATAISAALMMAMLAWHGGAKGGAGFSRKRRSLWKKAGAVAISIFVVLTVVALLAPRMILRVEVEKADDARFCITEGLVSAARDSMPFGGGFGAFTFVFNPYRDPACGVGQVWDKAHNSYLEGLIGLGLPFFVPLLVVVVCLLRVYSIGFRERRSLAAYPIAGFAGLLLVCLHSAVDFSLQIPGMAVFYAMFAVLTVTLSLGRKKAATNEPGSGRVLSILFSGVLMLAMIFAGFAARSALEIEPVRVFARALDSGRPVDRAALDALVKDGLPADRLSTCSGDVLRSTLTVLLGQLDRIDREADYTGWVDALRMAEDQVAHAMTCAPADGNLWLRLAMLRQAGGEVPAEQATLMARASGLSPAEGNQLVGRLYYWNRLSPQTIALARESVVADLRNALNYLPVADIGRVLASPSKPVRDILSEVLPLVTAERRGALAEAGFDWAGTLNGD